MPLSRALVYQRLQAIEYSKKARDRREVLGLSHQFASQILDRTCLDANENVEHLYVSVIRLTVIVIDFTLNKASMHKLLETIMR